MRRALVLLIASFAGSCTDDLRVLIPLPPPDGSVPIDDAGPDAGGGLDGGMVDVDAAPAEPLRASAIAAFMHTCATTSDAIYCWGDNTSGAVGPVERTAQLSPVRVVAGAFSSVCAGEEHSCALRSDGTVHCWGSNTQGQLGQGDFQPHQGIVEVRAMRFSALACGGTSTCGISTDKRLYCWGDNDEGQLGQAERDGSDDDSALPMPVGTDLRFVQVSLGQGHVCGVVEGGTLYCWGRNTWGQVGVADDRGQLRAPTRVESDRSFARVACGQRHSCAIDGEGLLYCWGDNQQPPATPAPAPERPPDPLLGVASREETVRTPLRVESDQTFADVAASWFHTCARARDGSLYCWGRNDEGQLGSGDIEDRATPTRMGTLTSWAALVTGRFYTCAARSEGLYCWGINEGGQLGSGDRRRHATPMLVYQR